jgi:hypothetical protein
MYPWSLWDSGMVAWVYESISTSTWSKMLAQVLSAWLHLLRGVSGFEPQANGIFFDVLTNGIILRMLSRTS